MTREEAKTYYQELAQKAGLTTEEIAPVLQALENEKTGKVVLDAFVPRPQYSSDLDSRQRERDLATARSAELERWYKDEGHPAYLQNRQGVETLKKYMDMYGPLTDDDKRGAAQATGLTLEQVDKLVSEKLREQGQLYVNLTKSAVKLSQDYYQRFKEPLDVDALEKLSLEKQLPLDVAYRELIDPKVQAAATAAWEAKVKVAREEGARDALSRHKLPVDSGSKGPHMLFDQKKLDEKVDGDKLSREAFMDGWNDAAQQVVERNK